MKHIDEIKKILKQEDVSNYTIIKKKHITIVLSNGKKIRTSSTPSCSKTYKNLRKHIRHYISS